MTKVSHSALRPSHKEGILIDHDRLKTMDGVLWTKLHVYILIEIRGWLFRLGRLSLICELYFLVFRELSWNGNERKISSYNG